MKEYSPTLGLYISKKKKKKASISNSAAIISVYQNRLPSVLKAVLIDQFIKKINSLINNENK